MPTRMSNFGEIAEPVSRAAWEDWDDVPSQSTTKLQWQHNKPRPELIESLLIFEGKYLYDCIFRQSKDCMQLINSVNEINMHMYKIGSYDKYIIVIRDYNLLYSSAIVEFLNQYLIHSNDVMVVQTKPLADFQSLEPIGNQNSIIRTVVTTKPGAAADTPYPRLEQPNMITGVAAGAISLREHLGLTGIAIICFVNQPQEYQVDEMNSLLRQLNIDPGQPTHNNALNSNLYI